MLPPRTVGGQVLTRLLARYSLSLNSRDALLSSIGLTRSEESELSQPRVVRWMEKSVPEGSSATDSTERGGASVVDIGASAAGKRSVRQKDALLPSPASASYVRCGRCAQSRGCQHFRDCSNRGDRLEDRRSLAREAAQVCRRFNRETIRDSPSRSSRPTRFARSRATRRRRGRTLCHARSKERLEFARRDEVTASAIGSELKQQLGVVLHPRTVEQLLKELCSKKTRRAGTAQATIPRGTTAGHRTVRRSTSSASGNERRTSSARSSPSKVWATEHLQ